MMKVGIHTDNYRLENRGIDYCIDSIANFGAEYLELNMIQDFDLFQGHGFSPAIPMKDDPLALKDKLDARGLKVSCLDAHYPLWSYRCVEHLRQAILFADMLGCDAVATTDSDQLPDDLTEDEAYTVYKHHLREVMKFADRHRVAVCIEPHGRMTNDPEKLKKILSLHPSEYLRVNFDTANTFIAGWTPQEFLAELIDRVHHVHVKDVSAGLAAALRGEETGIASSEVSLGEGVNAENIVACLELLKKAGFDGVLSCECGGEERSGKSFAWLSEQVKRLY